MKTYRLHVLGSNGGVLEFDDVYAEARRPNGREAGIHFRQHMDVDPLRQRYDTLVCTVWDEDGDRIGEPFRIETEHRGKGGCCG